MRLAVNALALSGLAAIVILTLHAGTLLGPSAGHQPVAKNRIDVPSDADGSKPDRSVVRAEPARETAGRVRTVAPDIVAVPPITPSMLERVDPRGPLSPLGRATRRADLPPEETLLHRPLATAAGRFSSNGHVVALADIDIVGPDETCAHDGSAWPCGAFARTAFRRFLRGRAPSCVVPAVPGDEVVVTACSLGGQDPAEWLVTYGWARATPGGPYEEAEREARTAGRGIFGPSPAEQ